jgi:hypothetical protein
MINNEEDIVKANLLLRSIKLNLPHWDVLIILYGIEKEIKLDLINDSKFKFEFIDSSDLSKEIPFLDKVHSFTVAENYSLNYDRILLLDIDSIILKPLDEILLNQEISVSTVDKINVGQEYDSDNDSFYNDIANLMKVEYRKFEFKETRVQNQKIYPYFNVGFIYINPKLRLIKRWHEKLNELINNISFLELLDNPLKKIFIHQIVFTMILFGENLLESVDELPRIVNYPIHLKKEYDIYLTIPTNELNSLRYDNYFNLRNTLNTGVEDIDIYVKDNINELK